MFHGCWLVYWEDKSWVLVDMSDMRIG